MKTGLFTRLAVDGIRKNKKLYVPYILSGIGMVMMMYIMQSLAVSELIENLKGSSEIALFFSLGRYVIMLFSFIFLFYTNSFLTKNRNKEFGLYLILGMNKKGLYRLISAESAIVAGLSLAGGLVSGIIFSKFAELGLINFIHGEIDYTFRIPPVAVLYTVEIFAVIYLILYLKSILSIRKKDPLDLMSSERQGEKPPKANYVTAIIGVILLAAAYYVSVTTKSPLSAMFLFLFAVIAVIIATYLLFISGSVAVCRLLQKNKSYFYRKNHFISVSTMTYRMRRNGAGLASICILSTMVLVMLCSSASMYFGAEDSLQKRFPLNNELTVNVNTITNTSPEKVEMMKNVMYDTFKEYECQPSNITYYTMASITGVITGNEFELDINSASFNPLTYDKVTELHFLTQSDYNRITGSDVILGKNEIMIKPLRCEYNEDVLNIDDVKLKVKGTLKDFPEISNANVNLIPSVMIVIRDFEELSSLEKLTDFSGDKMLASVFYFGYDLADEENSVELSKLQLDKMLSIDFLYNENGYNYSRNCLAEQRDDFYVTFGGIFFLGIILSLLFIFAAAMIIYYKQITEGYEDCGNYAILRKVGMLKKEIKAGINSQLLTVFFAPLLTAGIHLAFAFIPIWKILQLFNITNLPLVIIATLISFVIFGLIYGIIYKLTATAYYNIVSKAN